MPSLEAARPVDILVLAPALVSADILALETVALAWAPACTLAPGAAFGPFCSAAQEGVAAATAIAPTTPSMSGSFITALFMVAPPVPRPTMGHGSRQGNLAVRTRFLARRTGQAGLPRAARF